MKKLLITLSLLNIISSAQATPYCNSRFNYCIDVLPPLQVASEADNGDGVKLIIPNTSVVVSVWASHAPSMMAEESITKYFQEIKAGKHDDQSLKITYEVLKQSFYVVSGYDGDGNIFYERHQVNDGTDYAVFFVYPESEKSRMNNVVGKMIKSLSIGG